MSNAKKDFLEHIKKHLDDSVANLDGATRSRLNSMRSQALAQHDHKTSGRRNWLWAGSAALPAFAFGLLIYFGLPSQHINDLPQPQVAAIQTGQTSPPIEVAALSNLADNFAVDDLEILLDEEEMEMLADLDFLTWLSTEDEVGG